MEKLAEGVSDFGDVKATLYKANDGRHFVRIEALDGSGKPQIEWLSGTEHLEWLRVWNTHLGFNK